VKAIGGRVIVKRDSNEEKTAAGIVLPNSQKGPLNTGEVLSVGAAIGDEIKVGDRICFEKHAGDGIREGENDNAYLCVKYQFIMAVL